MVARAKRYHLLGDSSVPAEGNAAFDPTGRRRNMEAAGCSGVEMVRAKSVSGEAVEQSGAACGYQVLLATASGWMGGIPRDPAAVAVAVP